MEQALLKRMKQGSKEINSTDSAIAVAKSQNFLKQKGDGLVMTEKGRDAARNAMRHLEKKGYSWKGKKWKK